jgi:hypothetical protein
MTVLVRKVPEAKPEFGGGGFELPLPPLPLHVYSIESA